MSSSSFKKRSTAIAAGCAALITAGVLGFSVSASADPTSGVNPDGTTSRAVVAVGSNTTEDLFNEISNGIPNDPGYTPSTYANIASYNSLDPSTTPPSFGSTIHPHDDTYGRPNGSGDGRKALSAAASNGDPSDADGNVFTQTVTVPGESPVTTSYHLDASDVQIARSSSGPSDPVATEAESNLTFIPTARDAIGIAADSLNSAIGSLSDAQLDALYGTNTTGTPGEYVQNAGSNTIGDIHRDGDFEAIVTADSTGDNPAEQVVSPLLPQSSSGTRQVFLQALGTTNTTFGSWVNTSESREENDITALQDVVSANPGDAAVEPFSQAAEIAQANGNANDTGVGAAGITYPKINVGGTDYTLFAGSGTTETPGTLETSVAALNAVPTPGTGVFERDVYTVVPTANLNASYPGSSLTYEQAFVALQTADDGSGPGAPTLVSLYGFGTLNYTTSQEGYKFGTWEN